MPISTRAVASATITFLIVGLIVLAGIVGMTVWLAERTQFYSNVATEARDTRVAAVELRSAVQTAEASQRGFLLTRNEIYLSPYGSAKALAERQLSALVELLSPYADQQVPVKRLGEIVEEKFAEMDQTIGLTRARRDEESLAILRTNRGKTLTDEANIFFSAIIQQADERLFAGVNEQQGNAQWLRIAAIAGALMIVAMVGGAVIVVQRYTAELRQARDAVTRLNADLEQRVEERTVDLVAERDRAGVLLTEVNHRVANSLALVSSLVNMQAKTLTDGAAKLALTEAQDRIFAIGLVHKRLYSSGDVRTVTLDEYLASLLDHLKESLRGNSAGTTLTYEIDPVRLSTDASINLGVVATEWVTNAFKYAYPDGAGEIRVRLRLVDPERAELVVEDDGVGFAANQQDSKGTGLGSRIVKAIASALGADVEYLARNPGTAARLVFSLNPHGTPQTA